MESAAPVSMPPRRSCFAYQFSKPPHPDDCFNATTAFLLRRLWRFTRSGGDSFNATTAFLLLHVKAVGPRLPREFQCHHGVPASQRPSGRWPGLRHVSMPPRRSCFPLGSHLGPIGPRLFQCHHGVPASPPLLVLALAPLRSFNATTAFLLHILVDESSILHPEFQCHHGVPASQHVPRFFLLMYPVSMPPRRSCFVNEEDQWGKRLKTVSMPPRRSCFQPHPRPPLNLNPVSMPPRRSCFSVVDDARPAVMVFQCHHGVPASWTWSGSSTSRSGVSMPPRRSCFEESPMRPEHLIHLFQCHHGVPASHSHPTTTHRSSRVSMPPRRSCFSEGRRAGRGRPGAFQCHHGVPASKYERISSGSSSGVSMPPRRSCFPGIRPAASAWVSRFNATTAFLLPRWPSAGPAALSRFQCHHGVPASPAVRAGLLPECRFQCHHGVPASHPVAIPPRHDHVGFNATTAFLLLVLPLPDVKVDILVSMPPRRSCFPVNVEWDYVANTISMPPRRSCFSRFPSLIS